MQIKAQNAKKIICIILRSLQYSSVIYFGGQDRTCTDFADDCINHSIPSYPTQLTLPDETSDRKHVIEHVIGLPYINITCFVLANDQKSGRSTFNMSQ